jgi:PII-like signaling protein
LLFGVHHTVYAVSGIPPLSPMNLFYSILAGVIFGITGMCFANTTHALSRGFKNRISYAPLRPFVRGVLVALGVYFIGTTKYIGLGIPTIVESFQAKLPIWDFLGKFVFTTLTLGSGFKGGEVTPLFYIGATLGNALSHILYLPTSLLAGMGLVAVFAGAANTPITCTVLAMEIFGPQIGIYAGIACVVSYFFSGHAGIYHSQRIGVSKNPFRKIEGSPKISEFNERKRYVNPNLSKDVHYLGFLKRGGGVMSDKAVLRIYFHYGAKLKREGFWAKLTAPPYGTYLLSLAKKQGIEQAARQRISAGYLSKEPISYDMSEIPPDRLPQCLELIDSESKLRGFLKKNGADLKQSRSVLLKFEDPILDTGEAGR